MAETEFIAAIELGSSKLAGIVGRKNADGSLFILAYESEDSTPFIRRGVVYNLDKAVDGLTSVVNKLEDTVGHTIQKAYIGFGGQSFRSLKNTVSRDLPDGEGITEAIVDSISDENREMKLTDLDILDVIPQEYQIGSLLTSEPVGVLGNHIEGHFLNIVARSVIKKNLERCLAEAKIGIADEFIIPLANAEYVLSDRERQLGCALVDFGAGVTTVSIYRKNILRFLSVIPLGSSNITHDLMSLNIEEDEANDLKILYGNALFEQSEEPSTISLNDEGKTVSSVIVNNIVEARTEEIIANVWEQIQYSGYDGRLGAGLVFTGGGANLHNLSEAFNKYTKHNFKIRLAMALHDQEINGLDLPMDGSHNTLLSLLLKGDENCCEPEPEPIVENPYTEDIINKTITDPFVQTEEPKVDMGGEPIEPKVSKKSKGIGFFKHLKENKPKKVEVEKPIVKEEPKEEIPVIEEKPVEKVKAPKPSKKKDEEENTKKGNFWGKISQVGQKLTNDIFEDDDMDDDEQKKD